MLKLLKLCFILMIVSFNIKTIKAESCDTNEVYHDTCCYKLISFKSLLNNSFTPDCENLLRTNISLEICTKFIRQVITRLVNIYTNNLKLTPVYQFAFVDSRISKNLLERLSEKTHSRFDSLFVNSYSFDSVLYIENQPSIGTAIQHSSTNIIDSSDKSSSTIKCVYGNSTKNHNSFFYGDCGQKLSFICMKPYKLDIYKPDHSLGDRCSAFDILEPGGNWLSCQAPGEFNITKTQSCCMFNAEWMETFSNAEKICAQFNSHLYSLEEQSYADIPAFYLNKNYKGTKNYFSYWTSCWKTENGQKQCSKTTNHNFINNQRDLFINTITKGSSQQLNLTRIDQLSKNTSIQYESIMSILNLTNYAFIGRKRWSASNFTTQVYHSQAHKRPCFSIVRENSNSLNLSLPFSNKCYHMTLTISNLTTLPDPISINVSHHILSSLLTTLDILEYQNCSDTFSNSPGRIIFVNNACLNITTLSKSRKEFTRSISHYLTQPRFVLVVHSYSNITGILQLTCLASALDVIDEAEECLRFNAADTCRFSCPSDCNRNNDVWRVWQTATDEFGYFGSSSICQAAYHSNILVEESGHLFWNKHLSRSNSRIINNNGITANIWPVQFKRNENVIFHFKQNVTVKTQISSSSDALVLIQAVFSSFQINDISATIYNSENRNLKRCIFDHEKSAAYEMIEFSNKTIIKWNITSISEAQSLNTYYELSSIRFPVNILDNSNQQTAPEKHSFRFTIDQNLSIKLEHSPSTCYWYYNELSTGLNCSSVLKLLQDTYKNTSDQNNQIITVHARLRQSKFKLFSRIHFNQKRTGSKKVCLQSKFGNGCQFTCPNQTCRGYLLCAKDPDGCSCLAGFTGYACNQTCEVGKWGIDCQESCPQKCTRSCDIYTGDCNETKTSQISNAKSNSDTQCKSNFVEKFKNITQIICPTGNEASMISQQITKRTLKETCCVNETSRRNDCVLLLANTEHEFKMNVNTSLVNNKTINLKIHIDENSIDMKNLIKIGFYILNPRVEDSEAPLVILNNSVASSEIFQPCVNKSVIQITTENLDSKVYGVFVYDKSACLIQVVKNLGLVNLRRSFTRLPIDSKAVEFKIEEGISIQIWLVSMFTLLLLLLISVVTKIRRSHERCDLNRFPLDATIFNSLEFSWLVPTRSLE